VRQLAAAAGDGWLGSVGSPGQLETSLNSGYTVGPCNSYLEGPTPILWACCSRPSLGLLLAHRALGIQRRRYPSRTEKRVRSSLLRSSGARFPTLAASGFFTFRPARRFVAQHPTRRLPASGSLGFRPDAPDVGNARARPLLARCTRCNVCSVTGTHVHAGSYTR
jgi:hypothetical protein